MHKMQTVAISDPVCLSVTLLCCANTADGLRSWLGWRLLRIEDTYFTGVPVSLTDWMRPSPSHFCQLFCVIAGTDDNQLSDELQSVLSHRHLLEFVIERCSDVAPRFSECAFLISFVL